MHSQRPSGPTFKEFILFIIDNHKYGRRFDEHWTPIYSFCTPCSINYTLIAKVETFQRDTEYIIRQAGLETLLLNKLPSGKKIRSISNESVRQTAKLINKYVMSMPISSVESYYIFHCNCSTLTILFCLFLYVFCVFL